ncbi:TPA: UDP-N-acetylmuramoyl-L-alanine--D-glutamate ligase [Enterococcus faecium]|uniref:UDP-N-acetylmuramoyl-L-alanine--D-glutamate ligase n=1 Tax=Enterococcus faecium TaxID=1352 RepID=UPI000763C17E|nr:UDP-N-acetylmuramoyl-L-alanine--D-glutamate ligase [Enterococcus faecium]KWY65600.1 UDP-N-acetylmuramoylalanine--D-glutamate ligase [Enterococcus faecium]MCF8615269.1 UDP-N-acetylmuramoyl-L-alanine--D-glutamate ligase [Enterococcus faecium]MCF8625221.1 UDP-N-acetylmuramoyl-L-alanine--D-glutamate ligase [Enterococcus faecium]MCF8627031.1 UDP-N-acetylmuramoyl-L-alanine--D-glutamate ligase [Enterococcus faecium]MCF8630114.1 UDP-N-acetylmuramoyl-L-alanine--D-glutamate ligase [Enterococcus faeci
MKKISTYENKKVLVLGLAKSGVSAAKLLHELGALVTVNDGKPFDENPEAQELLSLGIKVITGSHPIELLDEEFSLMVKNPGIPYRHPLVAKAQEMGIPVITEVELAYEVAECPIIGITGTNGKTTTTTMTGLLLNAGADQGIARLAGNIGYPASGVAQEAKSEDKIVMELSSFQLMGITDFRPHIAVITNIYEAHIDYHGTRKEYVKAKWNLQKNMTEKDYLILNWNQSELQELAQRTKARVLPFSTKEVLEDGVYADDYSIYYKKEKIMEISELGVPGKHNVENALAAISVAKLYGISNEAIRETLHFFHGVPHRTQYVGEIQGRKFYNDSKATNILATKMALSGFETSKVVLLAGGLDRGNTFDELIPSLKGIKAMVVFGQTKEKLMDAGKKAGIETIVTADSVEQAVPLALENSTDGDVVLLSPANASWDQYPNFETRGNRFMEAVNRLK